MLEKETDRELKNTFIPLNTSSTVSTSFGPTRNEPMLTRKVVRWAKACAAICFLALVLTVLWAIFTHQPVTHLIFPSHYPTSESVRSHIFRDESKGSFEFTNRGSEAISSSTESYLSIFSPYVFKSRRNDPNNERCGFSYFSLSSKHVDHEVPHFDSGNQQSCFEFENNIRAAIYREDAFKGLECYVVHWYSPRNEMSIENCINLSSDNWYGGGTLSVHRWPLNRAKVPMQPFITKKFDPILSPTTDAHFTTFMEPYFLSARGVAILLDDKTPLFVSVNDKNNKICFKSAFDKPYDKVHLSESGIHLNYTVCHGKSAKAIHQQMLESGRLQHPRQAPSSDVLKKPVWSTRGQGISNETRLLSFVNNIKSEFSSNFGQLFIDGNYTKSVGNFYFDEKKFPHSAQIVMELDEILPEKKLKIGTEVFPFIPYLIRNKNFSFNAISQKSVSNSVPILLDIFNKDATIWYLSELNDIKQQIRVNCFRFSGGDVASFLEHGSMKPLRIDYKTSFNKITTEYNSLASKFKEGSFIGSGYRSQVHGLIADAGPFVSSWDHRKGLKSVIPSVITLGIMGYPFSSVGPIGGISHDQQTGHFTLPAKELYIRWLQLSIFFPVIEFSVGPWEYGPDVVRYTKELLEYRQNVLWSQYLSAAIRESEEIGSPIIRPLWWIAPDDSDAQFIDCEFLVGSVLLVAPVLFQHAAARDVYLPEGWWWQDTLHDKLYEGGQWLHRFPVSQFEIASFIRKDPQSKSKL